MTDYVADGRPPLRVEDQNWVVLASNIEMGQAWVLNRIQEYRPFAVRTAGETRASLYFRDRVEHWRVVTEEEQLRGMELKGFTCADSIHWRLRQVAKTRVR